MIAIQAGCVLAHPLITDNTIWAGVPNGMYEDGDRTMVKGQEVYRAGAG